MAPYALDGKLTTRFSTNEHQAPGLYFEVDMGNSTTFDVVSMQAPYSPSDYARSYEVQVSNNGGSWATIAGCNGTATPEVVSFASQTARYIRIVLRASTPVDWWSIDEFNLYAKVISTTTTTAPPKRTSTSLAASANPISVGQAVTYTARVIPVPNGGTISFFANGTPIPSCGTPAVNTTTGQVSCTAVYYASGHVGVQAFYSGDAPFTASSSAVYPEVVDLPAPGYWLATANGQVYGLGAAPSLGGTGTSTSGVFTFGTTHFYGSLPGMGRHVHDIRAILPSSTGGGYILVGADGGAFSFGTGVKFHGSLPGEGTRVANIVGIALPPDDGGYYMAGADGRVYPFGDAETWAQPEGLSSNLPVAAIAGT